MELVYFTLAAIALYVISDWIVNLIERRRGFSCITTGPATGGISQLASGIMRCYNPSLTKRFCNQRTGIPPPVRRLPIVEGPRGQL